MSACDATQTKPWLSVIIPTFNGEGTIAEALASLSAQNDSAIEVLVIDDGSTDSTLKIVRSYDSLLNLKILQREHTGNWVANTNRGIEESTGQYLSILHQDDRWEDRRLATIHEVLMRNPNVEMCLHPSFFLGPDGKIIGLWRCPFGGRENVQMIRPDVFLRCLLVQNFIALPAPVFKKDSALKVGLLDDSLIYTADWDFWIKISSLGPSAYIRKPLASFRLHSHSQTAILSKKPDYMEQQLLCVLVRHFGRYEGITKDRQSLLKVASFSVKLNIALMKFSSGQTFKAFRLMKDFVHLGPKGLHQFFRCSRIVDRTLARLRVRRHGRIQTAAG